MRQAVAVICMLAACASTPYWRTTPSSDIVEDVHEGSEVLLITSDRAIHLTAARVQDGFVRGQAEHIWKIPAGTDIYSTNYSDNPVDLAISRGWLELGDDPGPVALSTIRFARILNTGAGGGGGGKTVFLVGLVILGVILIGVLLNAACPEGSNRPGNYSVC